MRLRKAAVEDIPELGALRMIFLREANGKTYEFENELAEEITDYLNLHLADESFIAWLCIHDNEIIGTSGISFYDLPPTYNNPNGKVGYIMNMFTRQPFRRTGVAAMLFEKMLEEGKQRNVGKFVLHATKDGKSLYEKYGFVPTGDEMVLVAQMV